MPLGVIIPGGVKLAMYSADQWAKAAKNETLFRYEAFGKSGTARRDRTEVEHDRDQRAQHQEHQHSHQENPGRGQFAQFDLHVGAGGGA